MNKGKQRTSGSQRKSMSNEKGGRAAGQGAAKKRRGVKTLATRANVFREATEKTEGDRRRKNGSIGSTNKNNVKLSFEETVGIMDKRAKKYEGVTQLQVKESKDNGREKLMSIQSTEAEGKYRKTIDKEKVPI